MAMTTKMEEGKRWREQETYRENSGCTDCRGTREYGADDGTFTFAGGEGYAGAFIGRVSTLHNNDT